MAKLPHPCFGTAKHCRLSSAERDTLRRTLMAHCACHPVREQCSSWMNMLSWTLRMVPTAAVTLAVVTTSAGALAYAAEETVPGDPLYTVKVGFTEPIVGMWYRGENGDAWKMRQMERRLLETERLAITASTNAADRALLTQHLADQDRLMQRLLDRARDFSDPEQADMYRKHLQDILDSHAAILSAVASEHPEENAETAAFAERVQNAEATTAAMAVQAEAVQEKLQGAKNVQQRADQVQRDLERLKATPRTPEETEASRETLRQMERELKAVQAALEAGKLMQAEDLVRAARRHARELNGAQSEE